MHVNGADMSGARAQEPPIVGRAVRPRQHMPAPAARDVTAEVASIEEQHGPARAPAASA